MRGWRCGSTSGERCKWRAAGISGQVFLETYEQKKKKKMLEDKVKEANMYKTMFGLVECDMRVSKEKTFFAKVTPISEKVEVRKNNLGQYILRAMQKRRAY